VSDRETTDLARAAGELLVTRGLVADAGTLEAEALTGGVSSTLLRLRDGATGRSWCAKRPLEWLRVTADWRVPTARAGSEARFLQTVGAWQPDAVPGLVAFEDDVILMTDHPPPTWRCWKPLLLEGAVDPTPAHHLGALLGAVQQRAREEPALAERFANDELFDALRTDPFLHATAQAHRDLAPELASLARDLEAAPATLVHGDVSPKNVLVDPDGAIRLLDAECATWGAAHFDAAFLTTHVLLKWARRPDDAAAWLLLLRTFRSSWHAARGGSAGDEIDIRATLLGPGLLLARVDGVSPVEYLDEARAHRVRSFARTQLRTRPADTELLVERWGRAMGEID
jgi:5-methylthioribose kinase